MRPVFPKIVGYAMPGPRVWLWNPYHNAAPIRPAANDERGRFLYAVD